MKRSLDSIIRRLLEIYWQRALRHQCAGRKILAKKWFGRHDGMAILYERIDLNNLLGE